ncbi:30S ribosomal protein S17 [Desulfatitalea tepidiphila]|uniref:30S ribosomal protein S17 n=1 Tax=Desulfatitalea tepidiphila TaxID=1185843 RepID=UPI0006B61AB5|nr:30S ribosomal protein S17 [Desulfatitalea tepidiphila]
MNTRGMKRQVTGTIVSNKMDRTVVVVVERLVKHPLYKKFIRRQHKYMAHDQDNECQIGDRVLITQSRPLSKTKRWRVSRILERAV